MPALESMVLGLDVGDRFRGYHRTDHLVLMLHASCYLCHTENLKAQKKGEKN